METELNRVSYEIRGGAIEIHRRLGPGCLESAYVPCLAYELTKRKLEFRARVPLTLQYGTVVVPGAYEADFIVEGSVIVELKAIERLGPVHIRQLQTYLRLSGCPLGLILNFGAARMTDGSSARSTTFPKAPPPHSDANS